MDHSELQATNSRQRYQLDFLASNQEIELGSLAGFPFNLEQLRQTQVNSPLVLEHFSGLTAQVYHLRVGQQEWTLKRQRESILVNNIDGQTSFLNEIQRRADFHALKTQQPEHYRHIVDTCYASLRQGIILSPWLDGQPLHYVDKPLLTSIFNTLVELELGGFFEWDMSAGNLLHCGNDIKLYDFGYMYRFDPLQEFNNNGRNDPLFHSVERFETRFLFGYLLGLETTAPAQVLPLFQLEKELALLSYEYKYRQLAQRRAIPEVLAWVRSQLDCWQRALASTAALERLYCLESHRSMVLDLLDDLHGQSCTPATLLKADRILLNLQHHLPLLQQHGGLFFGDEQLNQDQLLHKYQQQRQLAQRYQLA